MKTSKDPRHIERIKVMQELFSFEFSHKNEPQQLKSQQIVKHLKEINQIIETCAPEWPIKKINKIDLAILRLAVFELMLEKKNPAKVIVDEAVELSKEYGGESSPAFINGVLGKVIQDNQISTY